MTRPGPGRLAAVACAAALMLAAGARAEIVSDPPLDKGRNINALMREQPDGDVHLVLIHGIRAANRTTWDGFRAKLCRHLAGQCLDPAPAGPITDKMMLNAKRPNANFLGRLVWRADDEWLGSQPFVDHYVLRLKTRNLIVDEINWWPLVFAFKCQFIVPDDTDLVGPDQSNIKNCALHDDTHFPWFDPPTAERLLNDRPVSGGGPSINRALKTGVLDWGISDAVLAEGNLKALLRETVRCAFSDIASFHVGPGGAAAPRHYTCPTDDAPMSGGVAGPFVILSHSLGAFLLLDTFAAAAGEAGDFGTAGRDTCGAAAKNARLPVRALAERTEPKGSSGRAQSLCLIVGDSQYLYFFANQFALMELGRVQGMTDYRRKPDGMPDLYPDALTLWATAGNRPGRRKRIIAFSDPGDILTFKVPPINDADVFNVYPRNAFRWFGFFESPGNAHQQYLTSDSVLKIVFGD